MVVLIEYRNNRAFKLICLWNLKSCCLAGGVHMIFVCFLPARPDTFVIRCLAETVAAFLGDMKTHKHWWVTETHFMRFTLKNVGFSSCVAIEKIAFAVMNALQWNPEETVIPLPTRLFNGSLEICLFKAYTPHSYQFASTEPPPCFQHPEHVMWGPSHVRRVS